MPDFRVSMTDFIAAIEFGDKTPTVTIARCVVTPVLDPKTEKKRDKLVVYFKETRRGWVINTTNALLVSAICGSRDTDRWAGHKVTLHAKPVRLGRDTVLGIRVKGSPELKEPLKVPVKINSKAKEIIITLVPAGTDQPEDEVVNPKGGLKDQAERQERPTWDDVPEEPPMEQAPPEEPQD